MYDKQNNFKDCLNFALHMLLLLLLSQINGLFLSLTERISLCFIDITKRVAIFSSPIKRKNTTKLSRLIFRPLVAL